MGGRDVPGDGSAAVATERILIAEDDPAIADSVGYSLRACGYRVDAVGSGEAVLESGPGSYDLLILDVMLPGVTGRPRVRV
jgi:DNA-binding response OmpR family regulator